MRDVEILQFIHKTAAMGVLGLRDVETHIRDPRLSEAVSQQLWEYREIAESAAALLLPKGEEPAEPGVMAHISSELMTAAKTMADSSASKIAEMVIQGNTMGITKGAQHLNDYTGDDPQVKRLAERLLKTEEANVEQMKQFL